MSSRVATRPHLLDCGVQRRLHVHLQATRSKQACRTRRWWSVALNALVDACQCRCASAGPHHWPDINLVGLLGLHSLAELGGVPAARADGKAAAQRHVARCAAFTMPVALSANCHAPPKALVADEDVVRHREAELAAVEEVAGEDRRVGQAVGVCTGSSAEGRG